MSILGTDPLSGVDANNGYTTDNNVAPLITLPNGNPIMPINPNWPQTLLNLFKGLITKGIANKLANVVIPKTELNLAVALTQYPGVLKEIAAHAPGDINSMSSDVVFDPCK